MKRIPERLLPFLICILSIHTPAAFGQQGDVFSNNTDDYNKAKEVDARRAKIRPQVMKDDQDAADNQDRDSITYTGKPGKHQPRPYPVFASDRKKNGRYVQDNRRPGFDAADPTGGQAYRRALIEQKEFTNPAPIPVPAYPKPFRVAPTSTNPRGNLTPLSPAYGGNGAPHQGNAGNSGPLSGGTGTRAQKPIKDRVTFAYRTKDGVEHKITWSYTRGQGSYLAGDPGYGRFNSNSYQQPVNDEASTNNPITQMTCTYVRDASGNAVLMVWAFQMQDGSVIKNLGMTLSLAHY